MDDLASAAAGTDTTRDARARVTLLAAAAAFVLSAALVARSPADFLIFAVTLPLFLAPGWPIARWYGGDECDRATHVILATLFGFIAGGIVYAVLRAAGTSSPAIVLLACVALAGALVAATRGSQAGVVQLVRLTAPDRVALGCLLLLTAAIVGPVFARIGVDTPLGKAYRAYFIADLFGFMSVVGELIKGHTPPLNPYNIGEALPYYWTYFTYPSVFASMHGGRVPLERGILLTQLVTAATLVSVWFVVLRNLGRSTIASAWTWAIVLVSSSFEGLAFITWSLMHGRPVGAFRYVNVDGLTRWWWGLPPVDGMHRALWYTPQHATAFTCGFLTLVALASARDRNGYARRVADGLLLGAAFLFSSFTGIVAVVWYAITEAVLLVARDRGRDAGRWLRSCACAAAVVLACVGLAYVLRMIQPIEGEMIVRLDRYLLSGPWRFVALSFGPVLVAAPFGLRRLAREQRGVAVALVVLVAICVAALLGLEAPGHDNTYLPFRTGNFFFLALAVTLGFAIDEVRSWTRSPRLVAAVGAAIVFGAAAPTVALDWYNARDISNVAMNPGGFPWTVHLSRTEDAATRWIRDALPLDAVVQTDAQERGRTSWALIPAFAQRRMAAGIVLFEPNPRRLDTHLSEIRRIFIRDDPALAHAACITLGIDYIYLGEVEEHDDAGSTQKFASSPELFQLAYTGHDVRIYKVVRP